MWSLGFRFQVEGDLRKHLKPASAKQFQMKGLTGCEVRSSDWIKEPMSKVTCPR